MNKISLSFLIIITLSACDDSSEYQPLQNNIDSRIEQNNTNNSLIDIDDRLPQMTVNTNGKTIVDEPKINAQITLSEKNIVSYEGNIGIEIRGSSSQLYPKKSYGFETRDADNKDIDVSLLGFPKEEDWILYAPYSDKSLIRNSIIYDLARDIGMYASRTSLVELTIDDDYKGLYVFMEKLKRDANRIDINKLKDDENSGEDVTGGYIIKIDNKYNEQNSFISSYRPLNSTEDQQIHFLYEYPKASKITTEQKTYISSYMMAFEDTLASDDFTDAESGYSKYIDVNSFIDFFLLNELAHNTDAYRVSTFMHKDKNKKLKMGPIWDFNLAFGNVNYCNSGETNVWAYQFNERCSDHLYQVPFWWDKLLQDPAFVSQLQTRWKTLREGAFSEAAIFTKIETYVSRMEKAGAIQSNFRVWEILGLYVWPNKFVGNTYDEEKTYLKGWLSDRLNWMDDAVKNL